MTPAQCRAARAILDLTQPSLAEAAGLSLSTLVDFEKGRRPVPAPTRDRIRQALEEKGAIFLAENGDGPGVRLRKGRATAIDAKGPATDAVRTMDAAIAEDEATGTPKRAGRPKR